MDFGGGALLFSSGGPFAFWWILSCTCPGCPPGCPGCPGCPPGCPGCQPWSFRLFATRAALAMPQMMEGNRSAKMTNAQMKKYTNTQIQRSHIMKHNKCTIGKRQIINVEVKSAQLHKWQMIGLVSPWKWSKGLLSQVSPDYWCSLRNKRKDGWKNWCWLGNKQKTMNQLFLFGCATNKIHGEKSWV